MEALTDTISLRMPSFGLSVFDVVGAKPRKARKRKTKQQLPIKNWIEGKKSKRALTPNDRRHLRRRLKHRRLIIVMRELDDEPGKGARRTMVFLTKEEKEEYLRPIVEQHVTKRSTIMTDENGAYNFLSENSNHRTVEYSKEYAADDGTNNKLGQIVQCSFRTVLLRDCSSDDA